MLSQQRRKKPERNKQSRTSVIQGLGCDEGYHARAIAEFTTGEIIVMSKWWSGMPRLRAYTGMMDIRFYMDASYHGQGCHMLSWRAANAPVFTLAYRGKVRRSTPCPPPPPPHTHTHTS